MSRHDRNVPTRRAGQLGTMLARSGWSLGGLVGVLIALMIGVLDGLLGDIIAENGFAGLLGGLLVLIPVGAVPGILVGLLVQFSARAWLRSRGDGHEREPRLPPTASASGLTSEPWAGYYRDCRDAVQRFHALVAAMAPGKARDWMRSQGQELDAELGEVLRWARHGEIIAPHGATRDSPAYVLEERLYEARQSFATAVGHAERIAVALTVEPDFERIKAQLEMLASQAPQLRRMPDL